jgi:hypothetical protein
MTTTKCDKCNDLCSTPAPIRLAGFRPEAMAGILLPERFLAYDFCSRECFIKWIENSNYKAEVSK